jgi:anhydro-N-acetylmuramic acid kinase
MPKAIHAIGLMSGTSVDSIDASLIAIQGKEDTLLAHIQVPYPQQLRKELLELIRTPAAALPDLTRVHYAIGAAFAGAAEELIKSAKKSRQLKGQVDLIGSHGQTIFHDPSGPRTLQIGEASLIAATTGVTTVSDFRTADTAVGGDGAPLLPYYHRRLFQAQSRQGVLVHNLGGISNYTYIGPGKKIFALDTGPANCLLDGAIQKLSSGKKSFDEGGALARSGKLNRELLSFLLERPDILEFRKKRAPKSTGRELFSPRLLEEAMGKFSRISTEDLLHTLAHFTVELVAESYKSEIFSRKLPLANAVLAGGGARNSFLLSLLQQHFPTVKFSTMEDFGHSAQALESQAFAYYAYLCLQGEPITMSSTTGAALPAICGKISPGKNWSSIRGKK